MRTIKLPGEKVSLAPVEQDDIGLWYQWLTDIEVALPLGSEAHCVSTVDGMARYYEDITKNNSPVFTIVRNDTGASIGRCLLLNPDHLNRTTHLGIFIGDKSCWNNGYGTEAMELLLDYCFNLLNLHSVMLGAFAFNTRAIACYRKAGFKEIGRRREVRIIAGKAYDVIMMDMLESEFTKSRIMKLLPDLC